MVLSGLIKIKKKLLNNSCRDLIWLINILPTATGYSFHKEKIAASFWIAHAILSFYIYIFVTVVYQVYYATSVFDTVNSFLNISIFILILNSSVWILLKRADWKKTLQLITKNDDLVKETSTFLKIQRVSMRQIKFILIIYYVFHFINDICIYIPTKWMSLNDSSIVTCFGLEPMAASPNREACILIFAFQELGAMVAVTGYDATLILSLAHTTAMYNILYKDLMSLNDNQNNSSTSVSRRLKDYIVRHSFLLQTVFNLQETYGTAIGVGFGVNAMSMSLFLFLPLNLWVECAPIVYYSLSLFFFYCFQGQRLTTATERLEMAVYCCGWEKFDSKEQKLVLFMLKQSQKPVILLAGHVVPIRIYTFAYTMQSIYKFFAVFKL